MQTGSDTWHAIGFLKEMQNTIPGTTYAIKYDENKLPEGMMWMTPHMKKRAIRYGDIHFLDAQQRPYTHFGWPYIAVTIKDGNKRINVSCEAIVATEDLDIYHWLITTMSQMVPEFDLKDIRLIFSDQFLKDN